MGGGSCLCGKLQYEYSGDPVMKATCHCLTCRKITGSTNTTLILVPEDKYKVTSGTPKQFHATHESGMGIDAYFCDECGVYISKIARADDFNGLRIIFAGTLDDKNALEQAAPGAELYMKHRVSWLPQLAGVAQMQEFA